MGIYHLENLLNLHAIKTQPRQYSANCINYLNLPSFAGPGQICKRIREPFFLKHMHCRIQGDMSILNWIFSKSSISLLSSGCVMFSFQ